MGPDRACQPVYPVGFNPVPTPMDSYSNRALTMPGYEERLVSHDQVNTTIHLLPNGTFGNAVYGPGVMYANDLVSSQGHGMISSDHMYSPMAPGLVYQARYIQETDCGPWHNNNGDEMGYVNDDRMMAPVVDGASLYGTPITVHESQREHGEKHSKIKITVQLLLLAALVTS